jgi:hypothetical protein
LLGAVAGVPAERALGQLEDLIVQGGVLIVLGTARYIANSDGPGRAGRSCAR